MQARANASDGEHTSEPVRLSKQSALRLLAVSRQAERSIDAVLHRSQSVWSALREYYGLQRREIVTAAITEVGGGAFAQGNGHDAVAKVPSRLRSVANFIANRWRRAWLFREDERRLIAGALTAFLNVLEPVEQPAHEELVRLRLELTSVVGVLEQKLRGVRELPLIYDVEYFAQPPWQCLRPIAEILV